MVDGGSFDVRHWRRGVVDVEKMVLKLRMDRTRCMEQEVKWVSDAILNRTRQKLGINISFVLCCCCWDVNEGGERICENAPEVLRTNKFILKLQAIVGFINECPWKKLHQKSSIPPGR